ncbi:MAG: hypothetical protein ACI8RZ_000130 [Myxococcota bacterium]|jgi:hypothetical protein
MSRRFLVLVLLCACGDKSDDETDDESSDSGITTGGSSDVAGDWEGVCAFPDGDINIDMVLNQTDRDLTGGADIWIVEGSDKVLEYDGNVTGIVTLDNVDMELDADKYGTLKMDAYLSKGSQDGEKLIGTCKTPAGDSGNLALSR